MPVFPRESYVLNLKSRSLELGQRTLIMGILNITPDSFSDAGQYFDYQGAVGRALEMISAGADLLDIGGESTRPGADPVPVDLELERVIPVIRAVRKESDLPISIDTTKAEVASQALTAGADVIGHVTRHAGAAVNCQLRNRRGKSIGDQLGNRRRVFNLLPRLEERRDQLGGTLSGGEQQMLCIGRALMARPRLLLLDEPSLGLAPQLVKLILATIREINARGVTVLLVEQNARAALKVAQRGYVLETGRVALAGAAGDLLADERVRQAYLGEG